MTNYDPSTMAGTEAVEIDNPDNDLSIYDIIMKYQMHFTRHFGPKYAFGVTSAVYEDSDSIRVTSRVRPAHHSTKGRLTEYVILLSKFDIWRNNIKLYDFISPSKNIA